MNKAKTYFKGIQVPKYINFSESSENTIRIRILKPKKNMQDDVAAFESWALILHEKCKRKVEMTFKIPKSYKHPLSKKTYKENNKHFLRFLFRAWKFVNQMEWFSIGDEACRLCVQSFEIFFLNTKTINNCPGHKQSISSNPDRKEEHILENIFVNSKEAVKKIKPNTDSRNFFLPEKLFNQLPNGLFYETVYEENRIFPTGFIDLWGINNEEDDLYLFELKNKDNIGVGIISELYFYANYANEIFLTDRFNQKPSKFRGYEVLRGAIEKGIKKIHACFLAPKYHSEIKRRKNEIQKLLNNTETNIIYHFLTFKQETIEKLKNCLPH